MTNGEKVQKDFNCEVCEPIFEDDIIHVVFADKKDSAIGFDWSWWIAEYKEPTTKSDLAQERYQDLIEYFGDEKVAKTILEDRKEFKAWLERLRWSVKRVDELARELEQIKPTTKNDLGVDCIDRAKAQTEIEMNASRYTIAKERGGMGQVEWSDQLIKVSDAVDIIRKLPPVTPQEQTDKNFTKADIDAIVKAINEGWELRVNEVLDKIRAEIQALSPEPTAYDVVDGNPIKDAVWETIADVLKIIDKYKAYIEPQESEDNNTLCQG